MKAFVRYFLTVYTLVTLGISVIAEAETDKTNTEESNLLLVTSSSIQLPFPIDSIASSMYLAKGKQALIAENGDDERVETHLIVLSEDGSLTNTVDLGSRDPALTYAQMLYSENGFYYEYYHDHDMTSYDRYQFDMDGKLLESNQKTANMFR